MCEKERRSLFHPVHVGSNIPFLNTCAKMLREGSDLAKTRLLQTLLDIHQSKSMQVNMKEPVDLERMKRANEIRRLSKKELRLTKKSIGTLLKYSENCGPLR